MDANSGGHVAVGLHCVPHTSLGDSEMPSCPLGFTATHILLAGVRIPGGLFHICNFRKATWPLVLLCLCETMEKIAMRVT